MVPDEVVPGAKVYLLKHVPDDDSITENVFFPLAGLVRGEHVSIGHLIRCRTSSVLDTATHRAVVEHCARAHEHISASVELVIAQGKEPWQSTQGRTDLSIGDWRGFIGPRRYTRELPVYAILHPDDLKLGKSPELTLPSKLDWVKVPRILRKEWPQPFPPRLQVGDCNDEAVQHWFKTAHKEAPYLLWDTEFYYDTDNSYDESNYKLTMLSITYPGAECGIQLMVSGGPALERDVFHFMEEFKFLSQAKHHVGHNFTAEIRSMCTTYEDWKPEWFWGRFDDSMHAHAELWSELPHTLEFLESVCSPHPKMKHLPTTDPDRNWGDTVVTGHVWNMLHDELKRDPDAMRNYREQRLKLTKHIYTRESLGLRVNKARVAPAIEMYQSKIDDAECLAQAYCGWGINLGASQQLGYWLYDVEQLKVQKSKNKHTKAARSTDKDAIASLRASIAPFDGDYEANNSITQEYVEQRLKDGAHPLLEAKVLFSEAEQVMGHYLKPLIVKE